jgi:hypothetical protein
MEMTLFYFTDFPNSIPVYHLNRHESSLCFEYNRNQAEFVQGQAWSLWQTRLNFPGSILTASLGMLLFF